MKRVKLFALISLLFIGLGHAWGAEGSITITKSTENFPGSYGTANTFTEYTLEGYKFKVQQVYVNGTKLQWRANGNSSGTGIIYNNEAFPGKITSVVIKWDNSDTNRNHTIKKGNSANPSSGTDVNGTFNSNEGTTTYDCGGDCDYIVIANGSSAGYTTSITINWGSGVTYTDNFLQQAGTHTTLTCRGKRSRYVPPAYPDSAPTYSSHLRFVLLFIVCQRPFALRAQPKCLLLCHHWVTQYPMAILYIDTLRQ